MIGLQQVTVAIKRTDILNNVSMAIGSGRMAGLIGRNGAGKTTLMRSIMGLLPLRKGSIVLNDIDLSGVPPHRRTHHGIGFMPEDRRLIPDLTVAENVLLPAWAAKLADTDAQLAWTYALMPEVQQFADRKASLLSGGQQKLVALARSLMIGRRLLLLDEPFEGVAPALAQRLIEVIAVLKGEGATVLISESDYTYSRDLVDQVFVIERGVVTAR
ncbi:MAG: ATP-binding cassette domain-containing protein [Rhodospirillales bacterium]|nr:ATP-binding cassette domain-containing protein [Rhodospirillales bacterium]